MDGGLKSVSPKKDRPARDLADTPHDTRLFRHAYQNEAKTDLRLEKKVRGSHGKNLIWRGPVAWLWGQYPLLPRLRVRFLSDGLTVLANFVACLRFSVKGIDKSGGDFPG
jgi:hypothetical protein